MINNKMEFSKDLKNKKVVVKRYFDADPHDVWRAWTESELLEQWWAPRPWRAETKTHTFKNGGYWLYAMVGPNGERHWARINYSDILPETSFSAADAFCDEDGNPNSDLPVMNWNNSFKADGDGTTVTVDIQFKSESDIEKIIAMGFEEGFTAALTNLDHYFATNLKLRKETGSGSTSRVSFYLNFPGNTEEAFQFYKKVFRGEYSGQGLRRFGDIEMPKDSPPLSEEDKKLIIHAELMIMPGYYLMATDAPESMGFKVEYGNNMHINLEPGSRAEAKRIFDELSEGGEISMPMDDMFWGAYFGSFKDKYGINWMIHHQDQ